MQEDCWWAYRERNWAGMRGELLLDGPSRSELDTGRDNPEASRWVISTDPAMDSVVFALARVLVFVIHLNRISPQQIIQQRPMLL